MTKDLRGIHFTAAIYFRWATASLFTTGEGTDFDFRCFTGPRHSDGYPLKILIPGPPSDFVTAPFPMARLGQRGAGSYCVTQGPQVRGQVIVGSFSIGQHSGFALSLKRTLTSEVFFEG